MLGLVAARTGMGQVQAIVLAHGIGQLGSEDAGGYGNDRIAGDHY